MDKIFYLFVNIVVEIVIFRNISYNFVLFRNISYNFVLFCNFILYLSSSLKEQTEQQQFNTMRMLTDASIYIFCGCDCE